MTSEYNEDDMLMLMLSGIQHFMFCPRQWALIHMDQQWDDNRLTVEGQILHTNVDDPAYRQKNGEKLTLRRVSIASKELGLYGITDAVELLPSHSKVNSIEHSSYPGYWVPYPIEYKRGHQKPDERDEVQLAAQAMCLEEMHGVKIEKGALYYGETKHREEVIIDEKLRTLTIDCSLKMHAIYKSGLLPKAIKTSSCNSCSLKDLCMPQLSKCKSVDNYLKSNLYEETS